MSDKGDHPGSLSSVLMFFKNGNWSTCPVSSAVTDSKMPCWEPLPGLTVTFQTATAAATMRLVSRGGTSLWYPTVVLWESSPHSLTYLSDWSPVGGTVLGRIRRCGLVGGATGDKEWPLKFQTLMPAPTLCLQLLNQGVSSWLLLKHHASPSAWHRALYHDVHGLT